MARGSPAARTTLPMVTASSPACVKACATAAASLGAAITIMPMPQLNVRSISSCAMLPSLASHLNTGSTDARAQALRQHARNVVGKTAAGDMREALHALGRADGGQACFHIDERGRQDR